MARKEGRLAPGGLAAMHQRSPGNRGTPIQRQLTELLFLDLVAATNASISPHFSLAGGGVEMAPEIAGSSGAVAISHDSPMIPRKSRAARRQLTDPSVRNLIERYNSAIFPIFSHSGGGVEMAPEIGPP